MMDENRVKVGSVRVDILGDKIELRIGQVSVLMRPEEASRLAVEIEKARQVVDPFPVE